MLELTDPDGYLSASEVTDTVEAVTSPLPLPGVEGSPLRPWRYLARRYPCLRDRDLNLGNLQRTRRNTLR